MTDKLLCPFCNKPLQPTHRIEDEYFCENYDCPQTSLTWVGTSSLWKALSDTKKKLDYAIAMLERIAVSPETMLEPEKIIPQLAAQAIEQINKKEEK